MDILDIKIKKEKLKQQARSSVLFAASNEALDDFIKAVDSLEENEHIEEYLDDMINRFNEEKEVVIQTYNNLFEKK